jgi:hypothetical protein
MTKRICASLILCVAVGGRALVAQVDRDSETSRRTARPDASRRELAAPARSTGDRAPEAVAVAAPFSPLPFVAITPCRMVDTRAGSGFLGPYGPPSLSAGAPRSFPMNSCDIPSSAQAVSLNVTVTNTNGPGFILIYPAGSSQPEVSTVNYVGGQTVANAAIVGLGNGVITVVAGVSGTDLILDVNGYFAASENGATSSTFLGLLAGNSGASTGNTGIGYSALNAAGPSTTGNTAVGYNAMATGGGIANTAVGADALSGSSGDHNIALGAFALNAVTSGSGNIAIGYQAGSALTTGTNNIYIDSPGFIGNEVGTIRIGNSNHVGTVIAGIANNTTIGGVPVYINGGGRMGTMTSSARFKDDIRDMGEESAGLMKLRPVSFRYKPELDPTGLHQYGLVAEEVLKVYPDLVTKDDAGRPQTIRYQFLVPINEVQKDRRTIEEQEARIAALEAERRKTEEISARLRKLEEKLAGSAE